MKPTQIIQQATESLSEEIRMNYVYGNMFLADVIDNYICELKKAITEASHIIWEDKSKLAAFLFCSLFSLNIDIVNTSNFEFAK